MSHPCCARPVNAPRGGALSYGHSAIGMVRRRVRTRMTYQIPVLDLAAALSDDPPAELLADARAAAERIGIIAVRNHGVDQALIDDFTERAGRLLSLPRAEKAKLASPHPYRGWRQWPDDFGRLELERFNVAQFDTMADAQAAGLPPEYL